MDYSSTTRKQFVILSSLKRCCMHDKEFWNSSDITTYFASKTADPRIVRFLESYDAADKHALDLGCGGGRHTELLAKQGFLVSAVDVNPKMLETTKRRIKHLGLSADIREGSILHIPFTDQKFDTVITTGVLHQATSVQEYDKAAAELARVMKPGAHVLLNIFTNKDWDDTYETVSEDGYTVKTKEGLLMTLLPRNNFILLMEKYGLGLIDDQGEDTKMENTGSRTVYRAFFQKTLPKV